MLSSCHVELWKQTRSEDGSETETSTAHLDKSCRWLQLVYGQNKPEPMSENSSENFDTLSPVDPASRRVPFTQDHIASDRWRRTGTERDLQFLRDRQARHVEELAHTREAKRRLEKEAANERVTRRRLERALRDLETKLAKTQRRVDDAHALVRMEVNTRRRCEQAIAEERAKRRALEEYLKKQAQSARPLLEGLAGLLQRGATQVTQDAIIGSTPGGSPRR
jgi:chromosome segregation ATPase